MPLRLRFVENIEDIFILSVMCIACHSSGNGYIKKNITENTMEKSIKDSNKSINSNTLITIDIEKYSSKQIKDSNYYLEHKIIDTLGKSDSLKISSNILSILSSEYIILPKNDEEPQVTYSRLRIYYKNMWVFKKDSVLAVGTFEYNKKLQLLSFSIINSQSDDFSTSSDLYLVDLNFKTIKYFKKSLTNTVNAFFSTDGKSLFYLDYNILYKYDYSNSSEKKILNIINDNHYILLNIRILTSSSFKIIYIKDMSNGKLYESTINLKFPIF